MHEFKIYTTEILKDIQNHIKGVCPDVFIGNRPTASKIEHKEFMVLNMPYSIRDRGAFQNSYYRIEIYVKSKAQGVPNIARLETISNSLLKLFPMTAKDKRYIASKPYVTLQGSDTIGYTVWNLQGTLMVNTLDSY